MNVIRNTADAYKFGTEVAADCSNIGVHAGPHLAVEPWLAVLGAKDDVKDNFTQRLRHGEMMSERVREVNRAFSADDFLSL